MSRLSTWITGPAGLPAHVAHRLRHPRRRRKVVPIDWEHADSYEDLLTSRWPSLMWAREPQSLAPASELLFPELATQEIIDDHFLMLPPSTGLGLGCLRDVLVSGQSLVGRSWLLYRLGPLTPLYVDDYLSSALSVGDRKITRKQKLSLPGVTTLITHWNCGVYGHWLLEGMPKLLLLRDLTQHLPPMRIVLPRSLPTWVQSWIDRILPDATVTTYDDRSTYLHCRTLLVPSLLTDPRHHFHGDCGRLLAQLQPSMPAAGAKRTRLYVSRAAPSLYRRLSNQAEIEAIAVDEGLELVRPESLPIADQITLFARAELLVGEFGSAMHNALFSPAGTKVFCLNWINGLQSRIARVKQQHVGYLLPSNGVPVKFVEGAPPQNYYIDPRQFRKYLRVLLSR